MAAAVVLGLSGCAELPASATTGGGPSVVATPKATEDGKRHSPTGTAPASPTGSSEAPTKEKPASGGEAAAPALASATATVIDTPESRTRPSIVKAQQERPAIVADGAGESRATTGASAGQPMERSAANGSPATLDTPPVVGPPQVRTRPSIVKVQQPRPAIFAENKFGTQNVGNIAVDAKWSSYGAYLQKMIEAVQTQWERRLIESKTYPASGSKVTVRFVMNDKGEIARIVSVDGTAGDVGSRYCVSGITDRAPYGPWTDDMKAVLGDHQEITFTFYYQ